MFEPSAPSSPATAAAYDAIATVYAEFARDELAGLPLDRALLTAFAEYVRGVDVGGADGTAPVVEVGCGPGRVTAHLQDLGLDASGVDLSPTMVELARETYPDLHFEVGSQDALDVADRQLGGVASWYSVIHLAPPEMPACLAEFRRVLRRGGYLVLAFFESEGEPVTVFDHKVAPAYRWPIDELAELAGEAGFVEVGRMLREPNEGERHRRGHLLMRTAAGVGADRPENLENSHRSPV